MLRVSGRKEVAEAVLTSQLAPEHRQAALLRDSRQPAMREAQETAPAIIRELPVQQEVQLNPLQTPEQEKTEARIQEADENHPRRARPEETPPTHLQEAHLIRHLLHHQAGRAALHQKANAPVAVHQIQGEDKQHGESIL